MLYRIKKIFLLFMYQVFFKRLSYPNTLMALTYHRVLPAIEDEDSLMVSLDSFERQMVFLKKHYQLLSADQLYNIIEKGVPYPDNSCIVTFDDGWRDNYAYAYPVLKALGIPALIFLSTDFIGTPRSFWHETIKRYLENIPRENVLSMLSELSKNFPVPIVRQINRIASANGAKRRLIINQLVVYLKNQEISIVQQLNNKLSFFASISRDTVPLMLGWEEVEEMARHGISFGSHTKSHAIITQINTDKIIEELSVSKMAVENYTRKPVRFFSYPNGYYHERHIELVKNAGYIGAFTCKSGYNFAYTNPYELKRKHIRESTSLGFNRHFSNMFFTIELAGTRDFIQCFRGSTDY